VALAVGTAATFFGHPLGLLLFLASAAAAVLLLCSFAAVAFLRSRGHRRWLPLGSWLLAIVGGFLGGTTSVSAVLWMRGRPTSPREFMSPERKAEMASLARCFLAEGFSEVRLRGSEPAEISMAGGRPPKPVPAHCAGPLTARGFVWVLIDHDQEVVMIATHLNRSWFSYVFSPRGAPRLEQTSHAKGEYLMEIAGRSASQPLGDGWYFAVD
jgi:hypothetical protein